MRDQLKQRVARLSRFLWRYWVQLLVALASLTCIAMFAATFLFISAYYQIKNQSDVNTANAKASKALAARVAHDAHDAIQKNVDARFEDCQTSEQVRKALREQVLQGKRTSALLFKLLPSLDTPEVHRLVVRERDRQLKAYRPRNCGTYAIKSVPRDQRKLFTVPPA